MAEVPVVASYRLQLTPRFDLDDAAALVPYLAGLGISHVYTSSYLQAAPGSTHGYDVVDPSKVNVELGGEEGLHRFRQALQRHHLANMVDVVPNHMAVGGPQNRLWWEVLERGRRAGAAAYFDIDWDPPEAKLKGKVLLAVLARSYAEELSSGSIRLVRDERGAQVHYSEHRFPVDPDTLPAEGNGREPFTDPDELHRLLERQHYRLACWTLGRHELNYRRFFEVDTLAGVRVEDAQVFDAVHRKTLEWVGQGHVHGLRIDHPDGLRDPLGYLQRLRAAAPDCWIVVEKILAAGESLPAAWPVQGTTGYDLINDITALFVEPGAEAAMTETEAAFTGEQRSYADVLTECKTIAVGELFATELTRLTHLAAGIFERGVVARDVSRSALRTALQAVLVATPVYRTYVTPDSVSPEDSAIIATTIAAARAAEPTIAGFVFDFIAGLWTGEHSDEDAADFVARLQQLSGPAMAKGAEDTAFYRYHRLVALNEVGADPARFGMTAAAFHERMSDAAIRRPMSMASSSTHDTKRSEDVRARVALLAEIPERWRRTVLGWREANRDKWRGVAADHNIEYLIYQTLVGAHPLPVERALDFVAKAAREAKQYTSWLRPDEAYEEAVASFVRAILSDPNFRHELDAFATRLIRPGRMAALAQTLIKTTSPGIPDFYQGSELWTTSLVDPDNRAEVDYVLRRQLLDADVAQEDLDDSGLAKLVLIRAALKVRRDCATAFVGPTATYQPLALDGCHASDGIAFIRGGRVLTIAAIRPCAIDRRGWADTSVDLPPGTWETTLGSTQQPLSGRFMLGQVMTHGAVALAVRRDEA